MSLAKSVIIKKLHQQYSSSWNLAIFYLILLKCLGCANKLFYALVSINVLHVLRLGSTVYWIKNKFGSCTFEDSFLWFKHMTHVTIT